MKIRGFELVEKYKNETDLLPVRETAHAAGYDLKAAETVTIQPGEIKLVPTGLKAYMQDGEVLYLYDRSSGARKLELYLLTQLELLMGIIIITQAMKALCMGNSLTLQINQ